MEARENAPPSPVRPVGDSGAAAPLTSGRIGWILGALAVALASAWFAFRQDPRPDPFHPPGPGEWVRYPLEWNAPRRLSAVTGRITTLFTRYDIHRLWAGGEGGLLLHSDDEGRSWHQDSIVVDSTGFPPTVVDAEKPVRSPVQQRQQQQNPRPSGAGGGRYTTPGDIVVGRIHWDIVAVDFADSSVGLVVAREAAFLTRNGGRTWQVIFDARARAPLRAGHMVNATSGWLSDDQLRGWSTADGGAQWDTLSEKAPRLSQVHFATAEFGAGIHYDHTLWITQDGGRTWRLLPRRNRLGLAEAAFSGNTERAAGIDTAGVLLVGRDSGTVWDTVPGDRRALSALGVTSGLMVGVSRDGRQLLSYEPPDTSHSRWRVVFGRPNIARVSFIDDRRGWWATEDGEVFRTDDGAEHWAPVGQLDGAPAAFRFTRPDSGFAALRGLGSLVDVLTWNQSGRQSQDGGRTWARWDNHSGPPQALFQEAAWSGRSTRGHEVEGLYSVADSLHYWYASQGVLYRGRGSKPNDSTEVIDTAGTRLRLRTLSFTTGLTRGFAASADGIVYTTSDTGRTWQETAPYTRWVAPWYFLTWIAVGLLVAMGLRPPPPLKPVESVADVLISDRPIGRGDPDATGLGHIAAGLAGFLRNRKTEPPLTIAVTGEWGTGKSSLMNLLRAELVAVGYRAVWFNAWHHQKEEHLLAALLETVQRDVVPPVLTWDGMEFRFRLLRLRFARYQRLLLFLVPAFALSIGYLTTHWTMTWDRFVMLGTWLSNLISKPGSPSLSPGVLTGVAASVLSIIGTAAGPVVTWMKGLKAFGASPSSLMASMQGAFKLRDVQAQTSFRYQFMQDFQEVTRALGQRRLLILIDDLDRCQPENVVEILEAISFLVSAGDCFIVLGMDRKYVDGCVGLRFKVVAEELSEQKEAGTDGGRVDRREFARHYLQKLVNIEVPVPQATGNQLRDIILPPPPPPVETSRLERLGRGLWRSVVVVAATLLVVWFFRLGRGHAPESAGGGGSGAAGTPSTQSAPRAPAGPAVETSLGTGWPTDQDTSSVDLLPGATTEPSRLILWLGLTVIAIAAVVSLLRRPVATTEDSPEFAAALNRWTPLVYRRTRTPREIKRFLNRVRLYSMQQHPQGPRETLGTRLLQLIGKWLGRSQAEPEKPQAQPLDEEILVALAALEAYDENWLDHLDEEKVPKEVELPEDVKEQVLNLRAELEQALPTYREQARGVRVD